MHVYMYMYVVIDDALIIVMCGVHYLSCVVIVPTTCTCTYSCNPNLLGFLLYTLYTNVHVCVHAWTTCSSYPHLNMSCSVVLSYMYGDSLLWNQIYDWCIFIRDDVGVPFDRLNLCLHVLVHAQQLLGGYIQWPLTFVCTQSSLNSILGPHGSWSWTS